MRRITLTLMFLLACGAPDEKNPPPIASATEPDPDPSEGVVPVDCDAFIGCVRQTECNRFDATCVDSCSELTMSPGDTCSDEHCAELSNDCEDDPLACGELVSFCGSGSDSSGSDSGSSTTDAGSSTEGSTTGDVNDECDAFIGCLKAGGDEDTCAGLSMADPIECSAEYCGELGDACSGGDADACKEWLSFCTPEDTSSGSSDSGSSDTGSESGSSDSGGSDTDGTETGT